MIRKVIIVILTLATVGGVAVWAYSSRVPTLVDVAETDDWALAIGIGYGHVWLGYQCPLPLPTHGDIDLASPRRPRPLLSRLLSVERSLYLGKEGRIIEFPIWLPIILFSVYPTIAFIRGPLGRHRHRKRGLCVTCGYDLTGNVSGVCPECGTAVERS